LRLNPVEEDSYQEKKEEKDDREKVTNFSKVYFLANDDQSE
jgi:hypothetical protein